VVAHRHPATFVIMETWRAGRRVLLEKPMAQHSTDISWNAPTDADLRCRHRDFTTPRLDEVPGSFRTISHIKVRMSA
jgi:hypothetical protein